MVSGPTTTTSETIRRKVEVILVNSINRLGVAVAGFATVAAVGSAFIVQGYMGAQPASDPTASASAAGGVLPDPTATATPNLDPQTIYIKPIPTPAIIKVVKPAPRPRPTKTPPPIHIVVPGPTGGDDGPGDN
jgi:hypothetical protein